MVYLALITQDSFFCFFIFLDNTLLDYFLFTVIYFLFLFILDRKIFLLILNLAIFVSFDLVFLALRSFVKTANQNSKTVNNAAKSPSPVPLAETPSQLNLTSEPRPLPEYSSLP